MEISKDHSVVNQAGLTYCRGVNHQHLLFGRNSKAGGRGRKIYNEKWEDFSYDLTGGCQPGKLWVGW